MQEVMKLNCIFARLFYWERTALQFSLRAGM